MRLQRRYNLFQARHGDLILPWFYGAAYADIRRREVVCYPVPLNHLIGWLRDHNWFIGPHISREELAYDMGYQDGCAGNATWEDMPPAPPDVEATTQKILVLVAARVAAVASDV